MPILFEKLTHVAVVGKVNAQIGKVVGTMACLIEPLFHRPRFSLLPGLLGPVWDVADHHSGATIETSLDVLESYHLRLLADVLRP